jgi:septal ring factor EnvC (AmiA/AmiB activator)
MMDIDIVKFLTEHSVMMMIVAMYIWDNARHSKTTVQVLTELRNSSTLQADSLKSLDASLATIRQSCDNTTMALTLINNTLPTVYNTLERHDKRSEYMNNDLREIATLVKRRPCMTQKET